MKRFLAIAALCACAAPQKPVPVQGLSKTGVFDTTTPAPVAWVKDSPGGNDRLPRPYTGYPPRVPHEVSSYLPITVARNRCLECHDVAKQATPDDPTPIPASHRVDLRNARGVAQKQVAGARYVCSSCHVAVSTQPAPVTNTFDPQGR